MSATPAHADPERRCRLAVRRLLAAVDVVLSATQEVVAARDELSKEANRLGQLRLVGAEEDQAS